MKGQALWDELERRARLKFGVGEDWHLCAVNVADPEVAQVELARKGPRGGWLRGRQNSIKGAVIWNDLNERKERSV